MSKPLTIVARIIAKPGREEDLATELAKVVAPTLAEAGCLQYDMHRDLEDPTHFLFFENWESEPQWRAHMESAHLQAYLALAGDLTENTYLYQMKKSD